LRTRSSLQGVARRTHRQPGCACLHAEGFPRHVR
jgi:hypothetical protein